MILDRLGRAEQYCHLHPRFRAAFEFLRNTGLSQLAAGKHEIQGDKLYVLIAREKGRAHAGARLEAHRKYIDIQLTLAGQEEIGWRPTTECSQPDAPFDTTKDVCLYGDAPESWVSVPAGTFVIFFPDDAHAPLAGQGDLHKAVVKVALEP